MSLGARSRAFLTTVFSRSCPIDSMGHSRASPSLHCEGTLFTGWVPASAAVAVHLPVRAGVGAIAVLAFGRLAFAGAVFTRHVFLPPVQYWSRIFQVLTRRSDFGLLSPLSHAAACLGPEPGADSHIFSHRLVARSVRPRPPRRPPNRLWTPRRFSRERERSPHVAYGTQLCPHPEGPSPRWTVRRCTRKLRRRGRTWLRVWSS